MTYLFSCDSSSISHNVGLSVCRSVGRSVCLQRVSWKCYAVDSVKLLLLSLQFITFEHSVVSWDSSSSSCNVGLSICWSVCLPATSFIEVLCCWQCMYVVSIIVAQIIRSFHSHILQFQLRQQFYMSQCQSVCP